MEENNNNSVNNQKNLSNDIAKGCLIAIGCIIGAFILFIILGIILVLFVGDTDKTSSTKVTTRPDLVNSEIYGEKYPYTVENLTLKCENEAVWLVDDNNNLYAVNGLAAGKLSGESNYKGYSTEISKIDPETNLKASDYVILEKGFSLCKNN